MEEEKVARPDVLSYEQGYKRGRQDGRKKLITEIEAGAVSVANLIEKARSEVAREIMGIANDYYTLGNYKFCQKYLPYIVINAGDAISKAIESKYLKEEK